ncbi:hypothetical protein EDC04DRAFT_2572050 [Pisolithus marmoratus]|nr:hypothetical protein EDC04DRAFT_2572050 [Pisolithus marmoratus]
MTQCLPHLKARLFRNDPNPHKGKGTNPKNWGALDVSDSNLDIHAQLAALASWNATHCLANESDSDQPGTSNKRT